MKKKILILLLSYFFIANCIGQKKEEKLVKEAFERYKYAILHDRGDDAVNYVDSRTIKYYGDMLDLVKNADSSQVNSLSLLDKLMVFSIRHRTAKKDILSFDGKGLLVYAIKSGMVGKNSVANNSIGEVIIENNFAKGQFIANGQKAPFYFHFYKEEEQWRIDLTSLFSVSTMAFRKMIDDSGQNENDYLFAILEMLTNKKPGQEIWEKIK